MKTMDMVAVEKVVGDTQRHRTVHRVELAMGAFSTLEVKRIHLAQE